LEARETERDKKNLLSFFSFFKMRDEDSTNSRGRKGKNKQQLKKKGNNHTDRK